uniref:Protein kinase domain-containing protein n=1 Tax=Poecilia latipinna TaxID=48699 RepID=A0A3B3TYN1_9TELE
MSSGILGGSSFDQIRFVPPVAEAAVFLVSRGRFGVIRECRENATGKIYMAKIIPYSQESKQGVLKEYEILKSLHSEKVMALHEAYVTPRYLVLLFKCSLFLRFRYSEDDVVGYLVQILQAVEYLHNRRVLHLDLKPENILVTNLNVVKIVDFGSAQSFNPLHLEPKGTGAGTLEYMGKDPRHNSSSTLQNKSTV